MQASTKATCAPRKCISGQIRAAEGCEMKMYVSKGLFLVGILQIPRVTPSELVHFVEVKSIRYCAVSFITRALFNVFSF